MYDEVILAHTIGNILLSVLLNNNINAVKETFRTLKPSGVEVLSSWVYGPNMEPIKAAARATRPEGIPLPRTGLNVSQLMLPLLLIGVN